MLSECTAAESRDKKTNSLPGRALWIALILSSALSLSASTASAQTITPETGIWGKIDYYSNGYVQVDGRKYEFSKTTTMDTYSLKPDQRGNVRVVLDGQGRVARLYFYGIDMPDVIKRYRH
ncbi:MAG TPA: hypothetical protein VFS39_16705 [Nitrospira sp.]|nr:hypothetical protein [Nitrospira sp.]